MHTHGCACGGQKCRSWVSSMITPHHIFWRQGLSLTEPGTHWLVILAGRELWDKPVSSVYWMRVIHVRGDTWCFYVGSGDENSSSSFQAKHFTNWAISLASYYCRLSTILCFLCTFSFSQTTIFIKYIFKDLFSFICVGVSCAFVSVKYMCTVVLDHLELEL